MGVFEGQELIEGVKVRKLKQIHDERGYLMEIFRSDWEEFEKMGQVYVTVCNPGYVKGWHFHKKQSDNFICIKNEARIVLFDSRDGSKTKGIVNEFVMGEKNPLLVQIPPFVLHGFSAEGKNPAFIVNVPTELYDYRAPDEYRLAFNDPSVPYKWKAKKGG